MNSSRLTIPSLFRSIDFIISSDQNRSGKSALPDGAAYTADAVRLASTKTAASAGDLIDLNICILHKLSGLLHETSHVRVPSFRRRAGPVLTASSKKAL